MNGLGRVPIPNPDRGGRAAPPGLPGERTQFAWDRTALGLLGHGALLVLREPLSAGPARLSAAAFSLVLAFGAVVLGHLRAKEISTSGRTRHAPAAGTALGILTCGLLVLAGFDIVAILLA